MIIFWKARLMLRMEMIGVDENVNKPETNKAESKDANEDKVEDFNEDTACNVCAYDF